MKYDIHRRILNALEDRLRQVVVLGGTTLRIDAEDLRTVLNICAGYQKKIKKLERKVSRLTAEADVREHIAFHCALEAASDVTGLELDSDSLWAEYAEEREG